jgi:hypothetical protein
LKYLKALSQLAPLVAVHRNWQQPACNDVELLQKIPLAAAAMGLTVF